LKKKKKKLEKTRLLRGRTQSIEGNDGLNLHSKRKNGKVHLGAGVGGIKSFGERKFQLKG